MKSYIHLYKKNSEFTEAYNGPDYDEPWLSLTEENMDVNYNKTPPEPPKELTAITFGTITWVTDIPATGGTATKDNCTYTIIARYIGSRPEDITSQVDDVTGELAVDETTIEQRHEAGQLTLSASYCGFTATGNVTVYQEAVDFSTKPLTFNILSGGTLYWENYNGGFKKTIKYNLNKQGWVSITSDERRSGNMPSIRLYAGDVIQFIGDNAAYGNSSDYNRFDMGTTNLKFTAEGNIMSLIKSTGFKNYTTLTQSNTFRLLFDRSQALVSAENLILPATTLTSNCYNSMFYSCYVLKTSPKLPATSLTSNCYTSMFSNCWVLTSTPELPATTLADSCYQYMFDGCISLTTAPALPATTLADRCYEGMFRGCTGLTIAPSELPATALTNSCYQSMFYGCSGLTNAPELPAPLLTNYCYRSMFYNCKLINYIKCLATNISATQCTNGWLTSVASTGTFVKDPNMTSWTTGSNGIPNGWTIQDAS